MDFGDILDKWEKKRGRGAVEKDPSLRERKNAAGERRARVLRKRPDASIDLHGLTRDEAWTALEAFFETSRRHGCEKIQIIHGKGNHRTGASRAGVSRFMPDFAENGTEGALKELTRRFIEFCPLAGESGYNSAKEGGSGATWVILKERN